MKNWLPAELGAIARAIDRTPRVCLRSLGTPFILNSPFIEYPGPPTPMPLRIAALDHEAANYSVENNAVIKLILYQRDEVVDRIGATSG